MNSTETDTIKAEFDFLAGRYKQDITAMKNDLPPDFEKERMERTKTIEKLEKKAIRIINNATDDDPDIIAFKKLCSDKAKQIKKLNRDLEKKAEEKKAELYHAIKKTARGKRVIKAYGADRSTGYGHDSKPPRVMNFTR